MWFLLIAAALFIISTAALFSKNKVLKITGKIILTLLTVIIGGFLSFIIVFVASFNGLNDVFYQNMLSAAFAFIIIAVLLTAWGAMKKKPVWIASVCIAAACIITTSVYAGYRGWVNSIPTVGENGDLLAMYAPYAENTKTAKLEEQSELYIENDLPRLDGATALYPVYAAFAKAVYPEDTLQNERFLTCTKTGGAYERIISGDADIIFVAAPSEKQKQYAKEQGVELDFTPIGREAFVFFVNSKNPTVNLSIEQIRSIYSGEITDWSELGVSGLGKIKAFQRDEGSGSQSALERLMNGKNLMKPISEDVIEGMGEIISATADYRNYKNAIGYSFRFYSTEMVKNNQIKLLSIDGVYPDTDNIENGTYPISNNFYAVTRHDKSENTEKFLEWMQGRQGQALVEKTGYTPLG